MRTGTRGVLSAVVVAAVVGWAAPAWAQAQQSPPAILTAQVSQVGTMLVVTGLNLGSAAPTMRLGRRC